MNDADRLKQAQLALHQLLTGTSVVRVQRDGRQVEFAAADRGELQKYINQLEAQGGAARPLRGGPAGVIA
ncbi:gpW family head-tail joining protein [Pseudomonas tohonis]|nr:head-tail joining protein [Pseudomonas alcaligenes OT 69]MDN4148709.1 gpW family head-tail joining protein [Pseudomonas tohonis]